MNEFRIASSRYGAAVEDSVTITPNQGVDKNYFEIRVVSPGLGALFDRVQLAALHAAIGEMLLLSREEEK